MQTHCNINSPSPVMRATLFPLVQGRSHEKFMSHFQEDIGRAECSPSVCYFSVPSARNNTYAKVAYFAVAMLTPLRNKVKNNYTYFQSHMKHFRIRSIKNYLILQGLYFFIVLLCTIDLGTIFVKIYVNLQIIVQ